MADSDAVSSVDLYVDELTTNQAADLARVAPHVIRQWKRRGWLKPIGHSAVNGRPRYLGIDVLRAEARTRAKPQCLRVA